MRRQARMCFPSVLVYRHEGHALAVEGSAPIFASPNDPAPASSDSCAPFVEIPIWWSGFLFHVLTPRQLSLYLYLTMLSRDTGTCEPTTKQIRQDLGVASLTSVFDAMAALEACGFIYRTRKSRRNVYKRPTCEHTMLTLLCGSRVDGRFRPAPGFVNEMSEDSRQMRDEWLRGLLGERFAAYDSAGPEAQIVIVIDALKRHIGAASP
jgi:hypothetical protein